MPRKVGGTWRDDLAAMNWLSTPQEVFKWAQPKGLQVAFEATSAGAALPSPNLKSLRQVHGTDILDAGHLDSGVGDGLFLDQVPGLIGVQTADCLPIVLAVPSRPLALVLHAGWRGLAAGILQMGIEILRQRCQGGLTEVVAILGPAIGPQAFEVGPEVIEAFAKPAAGLPDFALASCTRKARDDRWYFDLAQAAAWILKDAEFGSVLSLPLKNITILRSCTWSQADLWPSYRRQGRQAGRIWTMARLATSGPP